MKRLAADENGAGMLTLVLILLVLGGLILTPLLGLMSTGLMSGRVYEDSMYLLYAADAGIEDGLWQIRNERVPVLFPNPPAPPDGYSEYAYSDYDGSYRWDYSLNETINGKSVSVTIENVWIPKDMPAPDIATAKNITEAGELIVAGNPSVQVTAQYEIKTGYDTFCGVGDEQVVTLGIWLPPGFEYDDNCSLDGVYAEPQITQYKGGYAVVWDFVSPSVLVSDFPETVTFRYLAPQGQVPGSAVSWIVATGGYYAWDADVRVYKVVSTATDPDTGKQITVESYTSNIEPRVLGSAMSGDYYATGATLMTPTSNSYYRDRLFQESSATIGGSDIPDDARIEAAYLYWSGWQETSPSGLTIFYEDCSNFHAPVVDWNWTANSAWEIYGSSSYDQEFRGNAYYAMGEGEWQLLWGPENCQDFIVPVMNWDAESAWDNYNGEFRGNNYYQEPTGEWQLIWGTENCQDFVDPIMNWDAESAWDTYYGEFRGNAYDLGGSSGEWELVWGPEYCQDFVEPIMTWDAESAWDIYNGEFRGNNYASGGGWQVVWGPETCGDFADPIMNWDAGSAWDYYSGEFRGNAYGSGGSGGEWQLIFDDDCSDFVSPPVIWIAGSAWDIDQGRFEGRGYYSGRYLSMGSSIDLSDYASQTVEVSWSQAEYGDLEDDDRLYFAFSANGGSTWSTNYEAFRNDNPPSSFSYTIPNQYLTANFRMRFYVYFSSSSEYCYIDGIEISALVESSSDPRYLAMGSSIDLSDYAGQTVEISWQQDESGSQGYDDCLYFNFSGNGGSTWSNDYLAFCNDDPSSSFSYTIPDQYVTNDFRMRFYLSDFDDYSTQYCYVDNIQISAEIPPSSPESYLTMSSSIDLSDYAAQTVEISWQQDESGSQGYGDCLYFNFSGNGGSTWSTDYLAFCNDDPVGSFSYAIPGQYLTSDFRMRFYLSGFDDYSTQYCYVDNIQISAQTAPSASGRYLTMSSSIDLSAYAGQTVEISWQQDEGGYLESDDCLYFNFSADGGITWSTDYLAFCNDDPVGSFSRTIPNEYLTGEFRMRFYLSGFDDDSNERCYIDNIEISGFVLPPYEPPGSNLTMGSSIPLGAYAGQTVRVSWDQDEAGELEYDDCLHFSFSANGGFTWSDDYAAFCNDGPTSSFTYNIPDQYLTDYFKMRFHLSGFTSSSEYCYIDNIEISRFVAAPYEPPERNLAMLGSVDLSAYAGQTLDISWEQDEDGDLEDSDRLYFAFSADGGTTWSDAIEAFRNDNPQGNFHYTIPNEYVTNNFRMKFYLEGFEEGGYYGAEYCYVDDIMITAQVPLVETAKVNRVMFGTTYNMQEITAEPDDCQTEPTPDAVQGSWSYSCRYDATDIVKDGLDPDTLSGEFTLGHVLEDGPQVYQLYNPDGSPAGTTGYPLATPAACTSGFECTRYQWTYAGWSLVVIYSSPETKGHQLYLFDTFRYVGLDTRVTFPISNFLAPDDTTGSHLTYFVGEGDNHYTTDYITVNGYQLPLDGDPYEPYPPINPRNNVFNSYSNSLDDPYLSGVDVDTFDVSACIEPADSTAEVVLDNGQEIYNLVYLILSFRSLVTSGGVMGYLIR